MADQDAIADAEQAPPDGPESRDRSVVSSVDAYLDEQEEQSFPASDPHSDWSGPGG